METNGGWPPRSASIGLAFGLTLTGALVLLRSTRSALPRRAQMLISPLVTAMGIQLLWPEYAHREFTPTLTHGG